MNSNERRESKFDGMNGDRRLLRIKAGSFSARGSSGTLYVIECIENVLEQRDGARVVHIPKFPEYRLAGTHRTVNWNPDDGTFTIVGTGEVVRRVADDVH